MEEFKIIAPAPSLGPYIRHYWLLKTFGGPTACVRTVPTGMMSLIFHRGDRLLSVRGNELHPRAFLAGHEKTYADLKYAGQIDMISVVFRPAGIRAFFKWPVDRAAGLRLTAEELEDKELAVLEHVLTNTDDDRICIGLIERFLLKRLSGFAEYNRKRMTAAIGLIDAGRSDLAVLADACCLSTRQFNRVFSEYVGTGPKEFSRIVRFQRALSILESRPTISLTSLAYACGYYDQSHLIKEFKTLSGHTPSEYLAVCPPHSDYFS